MKDLERIALEKKITTVSKALAGLSKATDKEMREFLLIIKKPGWTTPAELLFTLGALDAIGQQVKVLNTMKANLLKAANIVGK